MTLQNRFALPGNRAGLLLVLPVLFLFFNSLANRVEASELNQLSWVAYWQLDEGSGPVYADTVGGRDAQCANCPTAVTGQSNYAQQFDGSAGLNAAADPVFDWTGSDSFTIELWVKTDGACTTDEVMIGRGSGAAYWLVGCNGSGNITFQLSDGFSTLNLLSPGSITGGVWHHIIAAHDSSDNSNILYIDGRVAASAVQSFTGSFANTADPVTIGHMNGADNFAGTLDEVALYARRLPERDILTHYYLPRAYTETCTEPVKIMPLGNSITRGFGSGDQPENYPYNVSYRRPLYQSLIAGNHYFNFVGSQYHGWADSGPAFDYNHEGHGGKTDDWIAARVYDFLTNNPADVVLLHIGTNGLDSSPDDVALILDEIDRYDTAVTVILARIIDQQPNDPLVTQFNDNVEAMAQTRIANGDNIIIVDQQSALDYGSDMYDQKHPNESGYAKMADVWFNALSAFLPVCDGPNIVSEPALVASAGELYTYDADAVGSPAPAYALSTFPQGMTIDSVSGLVTWTANNNQIGLQDLTVNASNSTGNDNQAFSVDVRELAGCPAGMANYWKVDEISGNLFKDYYYSLDDAVFAGSGGPAYAAGQVNGALDFDGVDGQLTTGMTTNPRSGLTVMAWINPDDLSFPDRGIISKRDAFILEVESTGNLISFSLFDRGNSWEFEPPASAVQTGEWTHVAATFDANTDTAAIYINGAFVASGTSTVTIVGNSAEPYNIGWSAHPTMTNRFFDGRIDEVAVFDTALTLAEIQQLYTVSLNGADYCGNGSNAGVTIARTPATQEIDSGETANFLIAITNTGDATLTNLQVNDALIPDCNRANLGSLTGGNTISYNCSLPNVTASIASTVTLSAQTPAYVLIQADDVTSVTVNDPRYFTFLPVIKNE